MDFLNVIMKMGLSAVHGNDEGLLADWGLHR